MRIRTYRTGDAPALLEIQRRAAAVDGTPAPDNNEFGARLEAPERDAESNVFVLMDDDETNTWGQAGTLEGVEGELIGYSALRLLRDDEGYHFRCEGAVDPEQRRRNGGRALLICALNRARHWAAEFEFEAELEGIPIYFEALLPLRDPASERLAAKCEMEAAAGPDADGLRLYRLAL